MQRRKKVLSISAMALFEFKQAIRLHRFINTNDTNAGIIERDMVNSIRDVDHDVEAGILAVVSVDWPDVFSIAERLSVRYTVQDGNRTVDIIHVAAALHLGAREFLTFDTKQAELAKKEGLVLGL